MPTPPLIRLGLHLSTTQRVHLTFQLKNFEVSFFSNEKVDVILIKPWSNSDEAEHAAFSDFIYYQVWTAITCKMYLRKHFYVFQIYKYEILTFLEDCFIILRHFHFGGSLMFSLGFYLDVFMFVFVYSFRFRRLELFCQLIIDRSSSWKSVCGSSILLLEIWLFF